MKENYRPVSLLSVSGMVLEKVVAIQMESYFETNGLLGTFQFSFRSKKSTISELLQLFDTHHNGSQGYRQEIMLVLYFLSAAFDAMSHDTLLKNYKHMGFNLIP